MSYAFHLSTIRLAGREGANRTFSLRHNYDTFEEMAEAGREECERVLTRESKKHSNKAALQRVFIKTGLQGFDERMKELRPKWDEEMAESFSDQ